MFSRIFASLALAILAAAPIAAEDASDHFHWRPAAPDDKPRPWAILLPGASGLDILGDDQHYFTVANWLNQHGMDVLVVDYRNATRFLPDTSKGKPGPRIARIVGHAVRAERTEGHLDARCDGIVIGWSLGGEGMWELAAGGRSALPGLIRAVGFYPSVRGQAKGYDPQVPVTVLQGDEDRITQPGKLERFVSRSAKPEMIGVTTFEGARHGFDVASITQPAMGGKLLHNPAADTASKAMLETIVGVGDLGCALD